jgi:5-hydroxyisourate hydrolase-like protein (transthyretin family)
MDLATCYRVILATALCLFTFQISLSQAVTTPKRPLATVSGTVTIKGKPAVGVTVGLRRNEPVTSAAIITARGLTDQDGRYRITNVAAGTYEVMPAAPAFIIPDLQTLPPRKTILVNEGENVEGIDFPLVRGGVITGRVIDADARPVVQQQVYLYRADSWNSRGPNQQPQIFPMAGGMTDDRGIYRAFGLLPGQYKVSAGRGDDSFNPTQVPGRATYNRVFHPDTSDPAKATIIEVTPGSEATGVDIALEKPVDTYSISGRVVDGEKGQPAAGVRLGLEKMGERFQTYSNFGIANALGEFTFDNVVPGKYTFSLMADRGNERTLESTAVEVIEGNVSGVVLRVTTGATVSGVIAIENESPQAIAKLQQVEIRGYVTPPSGAGGRSSTAVFSADGAFHMGGLPGGTLQFIITGPRGSFSQFKNFTITRIERDGMPQQGNRFEIKDGEQVTRVRIVVTYGDATLRGSIKVENGTLPPGSRFAVRLGRIGDSPTTMPSHVGQVDGRGNFIIEGVEAGTYEVIATVITPDRTNQRSVRQQVSLTAGATTEVTLTLDASSPKKP